MAKKLIRLYEQDTTDFSNNGLKILNPTSAKITRNLIEYTYQLELTHLLDEKGMMLTEERILGYNGQYFRISSIRRNLKEVSIIAKHIFFDLNKNFIEDINIKNKTGSMALSHILGGTSYPHSFSATSDIDTVASSRLVRKNVVSALIGDTDNSFINRWGGELDIDGFTFKLNEQIGKDDGYTIQYGKNLTGLDLQLNMLEVVTRIRPVGFDGIEIDGLYVDSPYIDNYALPIIKEIKYENVKWKGSPNYEEREDDDSYIYDNLAEAQAKLIELATNEFVVNEIDLPKTTINIEFIELSKTEEYKHLKFLQNINIGDTVHIYHKPLDINLKSRCIEYVYDCILNKYETITLGSYTKNFFTKTQNTNTTLDSGNLDVKFSGMVNDILQQTQKHLNDSITQAMGGYVYKTNNALYIMDTDDISTAQNIWTWNRNGMAFSSNGVNGPYTTGITMDGHIVGSMISANSITGEQIQANSIKTANLELSVQKKIQDATNEETVKALIKADLDGFESTLSKEFVTVENATTQIQQATEVAVKEATKSIIDNAVTESMGAVNGQLNDKLNQYTGNTLLPAIAEKAEEVLQNAEDYVVTKLESYATKQELSSSISQTREQIELSVSEKYTTKTESATIITEAIDGITVGAINRALGTGENKSFKFNDGANETWLPYKFSNDISDKEVYVSFNYTLTGTAQNGSQIEFAPSYLKKANNQTVYRPKHIFFTSNRLQDVNIADTVSFTTKDFQDISPSSTSYIRFVGNGFTGTLSVSEVQIKQGNSKTSWSPAPEDVDNDIVNAKNEAIISANNTLISTIANHYTKSETDSKISVVKDEINLGVSNTYETKTNVETKVASTLNSAKSYSDTKKTEAINAAATDATNKVNSAKTELNTAIGKKANAVDVYTKSEVYTKSQTDSAINIAKDAINLGVSNTYETKTNVETKVSSTLNSAKSYADTKKTEAINTASTDATNKANQAKTDAINSANNTLTTTIANYYTKAQTDSQINVAKNAITQSVSSTYETKTEVTNKINAIQVGGTNLLPNTKTLKSGVSSTSYITSDTYLGLKVMHCKNTGGTYIDAYYFNSIVAVEPNTEYTLSFYAKGSGAFSSFFYPGNVVSGKHSNGTTTTSIDGYITTTVTSSWKRYWITWKTLSNTSGLKNVIIGRITAGSDIYICGAKFEKGNKASEWSPAPEDIETTVSTIEQRVSTAESKITDTAITNTVKQNFYTKTETENAITSKGYATQSQVQQTADNIQFKFTQTGGYNLVRNGNPKPNNYSHWWVSGNANWYLGSTADIGVQTLDTNEAYAGSATFKVESGKTYSFSCWLMAETNTKGTDVYFIGSANDDGAYTEVHNLYTSSSGDQTWHQVKASFTVGSNINYGFIRIDNNGRKDTSNGAFTVVFFSEVMLVKGQDHFPQWSPNPNEVYDGITTIDKSGIKVNASNINGYTKMTANGFFVNKDGKDLVSVDGYGLRLFDAKIQLTHANGNKYFLLDENGIVMYNPANGTHQWGKVAAINNKFTVASNGNSSGLSLGHHVNENYVEDILCDSNGVVTIQRQMNHNGVFYNNYGQMFVRQSGQGGWEITGRSDSQAIKPGGANQGAIGSDTQYINQSWIANRYNPSSLEIKHLSHYVDDLECLKLVSEVQPARYFYKEYDEDGNDITTFTTKTSQLGLIYEDVRECSGRDLLTNEEDKAINSYGMVSVLWGAVRNLNERLNKLEYENALLNDELQNYKQKENND
nr:MAG TPA: tail protein [Caudoviricetes sp.]